MTVPTLKVLAALMRAERIELSGAEIARETRLLSGTTYPILMRLEQLGWLDSRWEDGDPHALGRPRRRFYRITALGEKRAKAAVKSLQSTFRKLAWSRRLAWSWRLA